MIIDDIMHVDYWQESGGEYHEGRAKEIIQMMDDAGINKAVICTTWMPSRKSNNITLEVYQKYPNRFIPFGHVRPVDCEAENELKRIGKELRWKGLKLHQGEFPFPMMESLKSIIKKAEELEIRICLLHCENLKIVNELTQQFPNVTFILAHLGCYSNIGLLDEFCSLARKRDNIYLDTSAVHQYYKIGDAVKMAGANKITFGSDGCVFSPLVELTKIKALKLSKEQEELILGKNISRILRL